MDNCIFSACKKIAGALLLSEVVRFIAKEIYKKGERDFIRRVKGVGYKLIDENGNEIK